MVGRNAAVTRQMSKSVTQWSVLLKVILQYINYLHRCNDRYELSADCRWGQWGKWGICSGGNQLRFRSIEQEAINGGIGCSGPSTERKGCIKGNKFHCKMVVPVIDIDMP